LIRLSQGLPERVHHPKEGEKGCMQKIDNTDIPPCLIFINKEGQWYHQGAEIIHRQLISMFYENMVVDGQGRYIIQMNNQRCYVDVEDTAFVVWRVTHVAGSKNQKAKIVLYLSDNTKEVLEPQTLFVGQKNVLYCRVKKGTFTARFNRASYYQLAQYCEAEGDTYYLPLNGKRYILLKGGKIE
jgi:hypothetical protein